MGHGRGQRLGGGPVDPGEVIMYYYDITIMNKSISNTVFSLQPKFLQAKVRLMRKEVLGVVAVVEVVVVVVVVVKLLEETLGRGPHHHP